MSIDTQCFFSRNRWPQGFIPHQEFSTWDCLKACTRFNADFGEIPVDLLYEESLGSPMNSIQQELYTDLLDARAQNRLPELLAAFLDFTENGG